MLKLSVILVLTFCGWHVDGANVTSIVTLNPGQLLQGKSKTLSTGDIIHYFRGIRYGLAPVGDKRFAEADPAPDWSGLQMATNFSAKCMQSGEAQPEESEDCLFLNVYTKNLNASMPVMVWFHGGGFHAGSGMELMYDGSTLANMDVVVVTVNSRIGPFGFLSTGDDVMPGNFGLMDQILALKWVQKNIQAFGGDPNQVTIFGESSGAASTSLHVLSPLSSGLFHRAIMQSGFSLCVWAVERPGTGIKLQDFTKMIGERVACTDDDSSMLLSCLRGVDAQILMNITKTIIEEQNIDIIATPRVETKFGFLPDYPEKLLESGNFNKVATMRGYNSGEYSFVVSDPDNDGITVDEFRDAYATIFESYSVENDTRDYLTKVVEDLYLNETTSNPIALRTTLINALTEMLFAAGGVLEIEKTLPHTDAATGHYLYELDYQIKSPLNLQSFTPDWMGVVHTGDIPLVFAHDNAGLYVLFESADDRAMEKKVQTMWTNFAKFGNPMATPVDENGADLRWDRYTSTNPMILKIDLTSSLIPYPAPEIVAIYDKVLDKLREDVPSS